LRIAALSVVLASDDLFDSQITNDDDDAPTKGPDGNLTPDARSSSTTSTGSMANRDCCASLVHRRDDGG
jgi:hypothetical protein